MSKTYKNINIYGVYEDDEYQECIFIGNIHEISKEFEIKEQTLRCALSRKMRIQGKKKKYLIYKLYKEG